MYNKCCNTFEEELKQIAYVPLMGLRFGINHQIVGCEGKKILDLGGGPVSLLLKAPGVKGTIIDPCKYPDWVDHRYASLGIEQIMMPAEDYRGTGFDEVWIYNVLQHVRNPEEVIKTALKSASMLRLFEWVGYPTYAGHPHTLAVKSLSEWIGRECLSGVAVHEADGVGGNAAWGCWLLDSKHLGGYKPADAQHPHGDEWTWTPELWKFLLTELRPTRLLDVGCGEGHSTKWFIDNGVNAYGLEGSPEAIAHLVFPKEERLFCHDLSSGKWPKQLHFDMIWCCEFVEHVDEPYLDNILDVFKKADVVCMTHAFPGQEGHHHVNCQLPEYWIDKMKGIGFTPDMGLSLASRVFAPGIHWGRSGIVFRKAKP